MTVFTKFMRIIRRREPSPQMKCSAFKRIARFRCASFTLLLVCIAGLSTAHILVRTAPYGATVSPDSIYYLSTALNFLAGEGWRAFDGSRMVLRPPLFSLLLATFGWVGIEPLEAGRWVNATAFGLTILAAGCWLRSQLRARLLALAATVAIAASLPLSHFASHLLTEPLFVLLTLLALIQLASFLHHGGGTPLLWGAVFTALAALTRYPGVVLIGVGVLLLLVRRAPPLSTRLKDAGVFGVVASLPLAGVLVRNWVIKGSLTGPRHGSGQSLSDVLNRVADLLQEWVIPPNALDWMGYLLWRAIGLDTPDSFGALLLATAGLVVVVLAAAVVVSGRWAKKDGKGSAGVHCLSGLGPVLPFGVFVVGYLVFIVAIVPLVIPYGMLARFLLPVYVPLLLAAVFLLDRCLSIEVAGWRAAAKWGLASLVLLGALAHTGFSAQRNLRLTAQALDGTGYLDDGAFNVAYWRHTATLNYIRDHLSDSITYSNNLFLLWFADRPDRAYQTYPHRDLPPKISWWTLRARQWSKSGQDEVYIVWLKDTYRTVYYDYNDLDIRLLPGVEEVVELSDGVVFRVRVAATEPFDADRHRARKQRAQERYVAQLLQQAGERMVRADWDVYRNGRKLTYFKKPCASVDVQAKFVLHVIPSDPRVLPVARWRYGSDNLDFHFDQLKRTARVRVGDQCIAIVELPAYAISRVWVGQWIAKENRTVWEAEFSPGR